MRLQDKSLCGAQRGTLEQVLTTSGGLKFLVLGHVQSDLRDGCIISKTASVFSQLKVDVAMLAPG